MKRPELIQVIRKGFQVRVLVDGEELPWPIPGDTDVVVSVNPDDIATVTLTLMATRVEVVNAPYAGGDEGGT